MHDEVPQLAEIGDRRPLRLLLAIVLCDALDVQERALGTLANDIRDQQWLGLSSSDFGGAAPRPKSGAEVSCPASMMPRRMARVRVK